MPLSFPYKKSRHDVPSWSWEEHGHQDYQRAEQAEHGFEAAMVIVALLIVAAVAVRLATAYAHLSPF